MDTNHAERRIPVYKLMIYRKMLRHLQSFTEPPIKCNFVTRVGWGGRLYADDHDVDEYKPSVRADAILDLYHMKLTDNVILTEEQYKDYKIIAGMD